MKQLYKIYVGFSELPEYCCLLCITSRSEHQQLYLNVHISSRIHWGTAKKQQEWKHWNSLWSRSLITRITMKVLVFFRFSKNMGITITDSHTILVHMYGHRNQSFKNNLVPFTTAQWPFWDPKSHQTLQVQHGSVIPTMHKMPKIWHLFQCMYQIQVHAGTSFPAKALSYVQWLMHNQK